MGKNRNELSARTSGALKDLNALVGRYDSYVESISRGLESGTFKDSEIISRHNDSCLSVIDGLGSQEFRNHLTSEQKVDLVNAIRASSAEVIKLAENQQEKDKLSLITAKLEASLKGFELPLSVGGPSNQLEFHSIDSSEYPKIIELTKQALQELAGQDIPPEQFPEQITNLIKEKAKSVFPPEQLEDIGKIIDQGNKPSKKHKFENSELPLLAEAVAKTSKDLIGVLESNKQKAIAQDIIVNAIKSIEDSGHKVSPNQTKKILNTLTPMLNKALSGLDPEYVQQYKGIISGEIEQEIVNRSITTSNSLGGVYIREGQIRRVLNNFSNNRSDRSDQYRMQKIEQGIYGLRDSELAAKLSELNVEKARNQKHDINKISDQDLAAMRKENPQQFDKIVLGRENPVSDPEAVVNNVIDRAIQKLERHLSQIIL